MVLRHIGEGVKHENLVSNELIRVQLPPYEVHTNLSIRAKVENTIKLFEAWLMTSIVNYRGNFMV